MERPHAPTPRRRALARRAGRVLTSPALSTGLAFAGGIIAVVVVAHAAARSLVTATRDQLAHAADPDALTRTAAAAHSVPADVLAVVLPIALAALVGAVLGQTAIARGLWLPLRQVRGAPATGADATTLGERLADAAVTLARAAAVAAIGTALVLALLPALAGLPGPAHLAAAPPDLRPTVPHDLLAPSRHDRLALSSHDRLIPTAPPAPALGASIASAFGVLAGAALATLAIAALATAALELVVRHRRLAHSLAMTDREQRDDARDSHGDPALRQHRRAARDDDRALVAGARVVVLGDHLAIALTWQLGDHPRPARIGRGLDARRLLAAARHARIPIVADTDLARRLAAAPRAVPDATLPAVATLLAAVGVRA